jgi:hypothetical protein
MYSTYENPAARAASKRSRNGRSVQRKLRLAAKMGKSGLQRGLGGFARKAGIPQAHG